MARDMSSGVLVAEIIITGGMTSTLWTKEAKPSKNPHPSRTGILISRNRMFGHIAKVGSEDKPRR